jgi:predicted negative regulator of RcsB-dependent stress response
MILNATTEFGWRVTMDKQKNLVAKHARTFNVAAVHVDKKKANKRGKLKHKGGRSEGCV